MVSEALTMSVSALNLTAHKLFHLKVKLSVCAQSLTLGKPYEFIVIGASVDYLVLKRIDMSDAFTLGDHVEHVLRPVHLCCGYEQQGYNDVPTLTWQFWHGVTLQAPLERFSWRAEWSHF